MQQPDVCFQNKGERRLPNFETPNFETPKFRLHNTIPQGLRAASFDAKEAKLAPSCPLHLCGMGRDV